MSQANSYLGAATTTEQQDQRHRVVIVGGGIAGLYCSLQLAVNGYAVKVLEATAKWGGRIETHKLAAPDGSFFSYPAEFGPMRFELAISPLLKEVLTQLHIDPEDFTSPLSPPIPIEYPVAADERSRRTGKALSPFELLKLGVFRMVGFHPYVEDDKVELSAIEKNRFIKWNDDGPNEDDRFDTLRRKTQLGHRKLHDVGFWNALREVLSPGAVSAINNLGSFYHLMPDNPNAIEWAIFWLRLFVPDIKLSTLAEGVNVVTSKLVDNLRSTKYKGHVELFDSHRVTALRFDDRVSKIVVEYEDGTAKAGAYDADHVILALPKIPVRRFESLFPDQIKKDLNSVNEFPLLKVFVVMDTPERWKFAPPQPQENVWLFPTREVHYFLEKKTNRTMMLLYTDKPAAAFWEQYVQSPEDHHAAEIDSNINLKLALLRQLQDLHFYWAEQYLINVGGTTARALGPQPFEPFSYSEIGVRKVLAELGRLVFKERLDDLIRLFVSLLRGTGEVISEGDVLHMDQEHLQAAAKRLKSRTSIADDLLPQLIEARMKLLALDVFGDPDYANKLWSSLGSCAIRDWAKDSHIGAGCHAWRPGARSWEVRARLKAFGLRDREEIKNVHVCGEAYSDYQGFIEGALRSAGDAVQAILDADGQKAP